MQSPQPTSVKQRPPAKETSKQTSKGNKPILNEQMGDVQIPLSLSSDNGREWMNFPSGVVDNLRQMITRLARTGELPARIAMVSALPDEGVSYLSRALATVMANDLAARICLVELNWWNAPSPALAPRNNNGLVSVITGQQRMDEVFITTSMPNLTIVTAGQLDRADRPVMARSHVLKSALDVLGRHFDHLILDLPAIRATNDAVPLATLADACVVVVKQGVTSVESIRLALDEIAHLNVIGTVLNCVEFHTPSAILKYIPQD